MRRWLLEMADRFFDGRWMDPVIYVLALPLRGFSWLTGRSTPALAADLVWLFVAFQTLGTFFDGESASYIALDTTVWSVLTWRFYSPWMKELDRTQGEVVDANVSARMQVGVVFAVVSVASVMFPNGFGEVSWWWWCCCYAGAIYNDRGGKSVLARARERLAVRTNARLAFQR
jgi:hypothetical protein